MNRKNLTAAVLAGLAGVAGIAGTAQAVNLNPDGIGQVLIYPYYTANDGNQTLLSVVNTTGNAKAVKVRFLEGFNSREVLDFNLYMSAYDVWVAAIANGSDAGAGADPDKTYLLIADTTCTVPYLQPADRQEFLDLAFTGNYTDGGPTSMARTAEGHVEMIEMGTLTGDAAVAATHGSDGEPANCQTLVDYWTEFSSADNGIWFDEAAGDGQASTHTTRNSGGLFGAAAIVNSQDGTMYSYDAKAIQGFDQTEDGIHYIPGSINPSLNDGSDTTATVFFGVPQNRAVELTYGESVDAVSAVFMHENIMNEFTNLDVLNAATEWVITFPTKSFYVDTNILDLDFGFWAPDASDSDCGGWVPGQDYPTNKNELLDPEDLIAIDGPGPWPNDGWEDCSYVFNGVFLGEARAPFTELFEGDSCDDVTLTTYDREEDTYSADPSTGPDNPPVVSPSEPSTPTQGGSTPFQLCYEVNVLRFGDRSIFGTPEIDGSSLLLTVDDTFVEGWGTISFAGDGQLGEYDAVDFVGLVGLPVTGFAAYRLENGFVDGPDGGTVQAYYGGLFGHKANVRRIGPPLCQEGGCGGSTIL